MTKFRFVSCEKYSRRVAEQEERISAISGGKIGMSHGIGSVVTGEPLQKGN